MLHRDAARDARDYAIATDLFGHAGNLPGAALAPSAPVLSLSLFDHAAERAALRSGRPVSQERSELVVGKVREAGAGFRCLADHALTRDRKTGALRCPECDR